MTYEVLVTETSTCILTFDTEEEAFVVRERINSHHELEDDSEFDEHWEWMCSIIPGWDVEVVATVPVEALSTI
jgi:hypothetical protein